jgi:hypothetical protein
MIDSDKGIDSLMKVMGQKQLQVIQCDISKPAQLSLLKTIQWTRLQRLIIQADFYPKGTEKIMTEMYKALKTVSHQSNAKIALQEFSFKGSGLPPTKEDLELVEKILKRLTELREFSLNLPCSVEGCCKLVKSLVQTNMWLERLILNGANYNVNDVARILNNAQLSSPQPGSGSGSGSGLKSMFGKTKAPPPTVALALKTVIIQDAMIAVQLVEQMKANGIELRNKVVA